MCSLSSAFLFHNAAVEMKGDEGLARHHAESQPIATSTLDLLSWKASALPADNEVVKTEIKVGAVWKHTSLPHPGTALLGPVMAALVKSVCKARSAALRALHVEPTLWEQSDRKVFVQHRPFGKMSPHGGTSSPLFDSKFYTNSINFKGVAPEFMLLVANTESAPRAWFLSLWLFVDFCSFYKPMSVKPMLNSSK